ncbi:LacI family transcriptional regulator [Vibrio breoganii]|nr:substrate-binding domain-containing protein [Vibrio breoganii]PMP06793.1 LacI family transcriptional regulator [Vibrio breoganii]
MDMSKANKKVTVQQVAEIAGVSASTVSRFLNQTTYIADNKKRDILEAIRQTGYRARVAKCNERLNKSRTIGVLVQNPESPHTTRIIEDMEKVLIACGYSILIAAGHWQPKSQLHALEYLKKSDVDGVVIVTGNLKPQQIMDYAKSLPVIAVGYQLSGENVHSLSIDNSIGGYMATLHLLQKGHTQIAHIKGIREQPDGAARFEGYKHALREAGLDIKPQLIKQGDFNSESGYQNTIELLDSKVPFTAIFAGNDQTAYGAIKALHDRGLRVPEDVAVIGFDDLATSRYFTPSLTTMRQPIEEIGAVCAESMIRILEIGKPLTPRLPPIELLVRQST